MHHRVRFALAPLTPVTNAELATLRSELARMDVFAQTIRAAALRRGRPNAALEAVTETDVAVAVEMAILSPFYARSYTLQRRFIELWRDCDPGMRPALNGARRRLALLEGG